MFGKILYISDNVAYIENKMTENTGADLLNLHLIFETGDHKVLSEITEVTKDEIRVKFLGEYRDGRYYSGILKKASLNSHIRVINQSELLELIGTHQKTNFLLGSSSIYKGFPIYLNINDFLASHFCIFGNSGAGKSCGVARIVQNLLSNKDAVAYNASLIFFDSFGEYKNAFSQISNINENYHYKFITSRQKDEGDLPISIPINLLKVDDIAILLQAEKHSQLTILEHAMRLASIFALDTPESRKYKNHIIANALINILYSTDTTQQKKDDIFSIIHTCNTPEFNLDVQVPGVGYTRSFFECFQIDSRGKFGEEVLITNYILKFIDESIKIDQMNHQVTYTLEDFSKALEFTLISEGFQKNQNLHDDAELLRVRLYGILHSEAGRMFQGTRYVTYPEWITDLVSINGRKAQIININLEGLDDALSKSLVKIYSHLLFEFSKENANRATVPFHLFLEEAHRYVQKDRDVFLLGYNIFERIAKEGRKYGVILGIISQRPMEISDTVIAQCGNFLIFKMTHPKDIQYIEEMLPNISQDVIEKMKILQPGTCVGFGSAFKIPMIVSLEMPNPRPYSASCDVSTYWSSNVDFSNDISGSFNDFTSAAKVNVEQDLSNAYVPQDVNLNLPEVEKKENKFINPIEG